MSKHLDEDWLREQYVEKERRPAEIAEECGVHQDTIYYHIDKHGFPKVDHSKYNGWPTDKPYHDESWLRREYIERRRSTSDIAKECGVSHETIRRWLRKFDIPVRDASEATKAEWEGDDERRKTMSKWMSQARAENHPRPTSIHPNIFTRKNGYRVAVDGVTKDQASMHRLLAVAKYGFDALKGKHVHHRNEVKWDNRESNIELLTPGEHMRLHKNWEK